jgi:hypothetical protein
VVAKEVKFGYGEHALLQVESQAVGGADGEECPQVFPVLLPSFSVYSAIILKGNNITRPIKMLSLRYWRVRVPGQKRLNEIPKVDGFAIVVLGTSASAMVSFGLVNFRKTGAAYHGVIEGLHVRQGVPVRHCESVEAVDVTAGAPEAILFGHQMQEGCPG